MNNDKTPRLLAALESIVRADPRTIREIAVTAWPKLSAKSAETQLRRTIGLEGRKNWPTDESLAALGPALGWAEQGCEAKFAVETFLAEQRAVRVALVARLGYLVRANYADR